VRIFGKELTSSLHLNTVAEPNDAKSAVVRYRDTIAHLAQPALARREVLEFTMTRGVVVPERKCRSGTTHAAATQLRAAFSPKRVPPTALSNLRPPPG
jgi:hypothetical protein